MKIADAREPAQNNSNPTSKRGTQNDHGARCHITTRKPAENTT